MNDWPVHKSASPFRANCSSVFIIHKLRSNIHVKLKMIEQQQVDLMSESMFFISIQQDGDPVIMADTTSDSASQSLSSSLSKKSRLEERLRSHRPSLSSSPRDAKLRRDVHLASKQQRLADEGRRRKETVTQMRRRQEREQREWWSKMKEREFVVQYRRERLRHVPRSKLLETDVNTENLSFMAGLIGATWLRRKIRPLIEAFFGTHIIDLASEKDYEQMKEAMMNRETIKISTLLILRLVKCDLIASKLTRTNKAGRILLTALLLDGYGQEVLPEATISQQSLLENAGQLSEAIRSYLKSSLRSQQLLVAEHWSNFCESFTEWQSSDLKVLVKDMQSDYVQLQTIIQSMGDEAKAEWRPHVLRHQNRLRKALLRVAGANAVQTLEMKLTELKLNSSVINQHTKDKQINEELSFTVNPIDTTSVKHVEETLGKDLQNIRIIHELFVDPTFDHRKLMEQKFGKLYNSQPKPEYIVASKDTSDFLRFILLIKEQLLEMLHHKGEIASLLNEHLQKAFLIEQHINRALEPTLILQFVLECMGKMCAPARDPLIAILSQQLQSETNDKSLSEACADLSHILLLMHEDMSNFGLMMVRPHLAKIIISYEREWYAANVLNRPLSNAASLTAAIAQRYQFNGKEKPLNMVYTVILQSILTVIGLPSMELSIAIPKFDEHELFVLDSDRLGRISRQLSMIIQVSAIALKLKALHHPNYEEAVDRILDLVTSEAAEQSIQEESTRHIKDRQQRSIIQNSISSILGDKDQLVQLLRRRVSSLLQQILSAEEETSQKPTSILHRNGLIEVLCPTFNDLADELLRMYRLHREVLSPIYNQLLNR